MTLSSTRVLVVGSHSESGFSMLNFTRDNFAALKSIDGNLEFVFTKPLAVFSKFIPSRATKRYLTYLDKFVLFGPYLYLLSFAKKINIVHVLDQSDAIYRIFIGGKYKFIVTVHDLFAIQAAEYKIPGVVIALPGRIYQRLISFGLSKADLALAISNTTERDVAMHFPQLSTQVVHNFLDMQKYLVPEFDYKDNSENYFLILMNAHWRKDRISSIKVWLRLILLEDFRESNLVIVGNSLTPDEISLITSTYLSRVSVFEKLESAEVDELYRGSTAVINISKKEGFGLPLIEANVFGRVCIYGGSVAFHEIAGPVNIDWDLIEHSSIPQNFSELIVSEEVRRKAYEYVINNFSVQKYSLSVIAAYLSLLQDESDVR